MAQDLVLQRAPAGAVDINGVEVPMANGLSGQTLMRLPNEFGVLNAVDFYLDLIAQQPRHHNIVLGCSSREGGFTLLAIAWNSGFGYQLVIDIGERVRDPLTPIGININMASRPDLAPPTPEVPVLNCPDYPLSRMTSVIAPYGHRPVSIPNFRMHHGFNGKKDLLRTAPPFTWPPTTTPQP